MSSVRESRINQSDSKQCQMQRSFQTITEKPSSTASGLCILVQHTFIGEEEFKCRTKHRKLRQALFSNLIGWKATTIETTVSSHSQRTSSNLIQVKK